MMKRARFFVLAAAVLLHQGASAQELADLNKPITLDIPGMELPFVSSLQPLGGWPLTIRMFANKPIGIGTYGSRGLFPPEQSPAWIVWSDPDGCFSFAMALPGHECASRDETYLEFAPGLTSQGSTGDPLIVKTYQFPTQDHPEIVGNKKERSLGLQLGGFGRSTAIPGLVILSDTGVGREFTLDEAKGIAQTGRARNLAGFVNSVAWTVNDRMPFLPRTSVTAQMNVPRGLFKPILFVDYGDCPSTPGLVCEIWSWTLEGRSASGSPAAMLAALNGKVTTVRIFVVNGPAPEFLDDVNHDGVIDHRDALLTLQPDDQPGDGFNTGGVPYRLISGERVVRFQTLDQEEFPGIPFDFDGNGMVHPPAPAGPGGVGTIPR